MDHVTCDVTCLRILSRFPLDVRLFASVPNLVSLVSFCHEHLTISEAQAHNY